MQLCFSGSWRFPFPHNVETMVEGVRRRLKRSVAEARSLRLRKVGDRAKRECDLFVGCFGPYAMQALAASVGYGATLCVAQGSGYYCGISCVSTVAPVVGAMGVGAASVVAGRFAEAYKLYPEHGPKAFLKSWKKADRTDILVDAFVGMVACKLLGGRFRTVMPSDVKFPGAFANKSIVVKGPKAGEYQRKENQLNFKQSGCHHCGTRFGRIIADHQPPNKQYTAMKKSAEAFENMSERFGAGRYFRAAWGFLIEESLPSQRLFPQCGGCSKIQANAVRNNKKILVMHWGGLRPFHVAAGVLVGARYHEDKNRR
ncbi:hypothetical protein BSKO_05552 [Bryopsis sp. KO-2023]|nr:hypothetical protein BSKO_05552 [Bryopsis sp. KO-2023]